MTEPGDEFAALVDAPAVLAGAVVAALEAGAEDAAAELLTGAALLELPPPDDSAADETGAGVDDALIPLQYDMAS